MLCWRGIEGLLNDACLMQAAQVEVDIDVDERHGISPGNVSHVLSDVLSLHNSLTLSINLRKDCSASCHSF